MKNCFRPVLFVHRRGFRAPRSLLLLNENRRVVPWKTVCGFLVLTMGLKVTSKEDEVTCSECRKDRGRTK